MSADHNPDSVNSLASIPLANAPLRMPIEQLVSKYRGQAWRIAQAKDMTDYASHPCAILSNADYAVFAKFSEAMNGQDQFNIEIAGLRLLSERAGVLVPIPIGVVSVVGGSVMLLEAVRAVERTPRHWQDIGRMLARLHQVKGTQFGLGTHGYFGVLPQDNTPLEDWPTFYAERRLRPMLKLAIASGHLPSTVIRQVETLIARLPDLCGPTVTPSLLHGDAQQNNFISTEAGAVVIDPAVYFGHPEIDLATLDYFQPVPQAVFDGYREVLPIDPGFAERRELWRMWSHLAVASVAGGEYVGRLVEAVHRYV